MLVEKDCLGIIRGEKTEYEIRVSETSMIESKEDNDFIALIGPC